MPTLSDLGLASTAQPWLEAAHDLVPAELALPHGRALTVLLERLGLSDDDHASLPALLDDVIRTPELRWIAERFAATLRNGLGELGAPPPFGDPAQAWPTLGPQWGEAGRCVYVAALLDTHPAIHRLLIQRRIPENVADATLADLGRQMWVHKRTTGMTGLDTQLWMLLVWSGGLVDLGRLQGEWLDPHRVGLHIPESGPLPPAAVDDALTRLREGWPTWFGVTPTEAVCESWMLDPHLSDMLPDSNIASFARRFALDEGGRIDDGSPLYFVFRRRGLNVPDDLASLPRDTRLQRTILEHVEDGGHWTVRRGRFRLSP